jgi:hypothetical protein
MESVRESPSPGGSEAKKNRDLMRVSVAANFQRLIVVIIPDIFEFVKMFCKPFILLSTHAPFIGS